MQMRRIQLYYITNTVKRLIIRKVQVVGALLSIDNEQYAPTARPA